MKTLAIVNVNENNEIVGSPEVVDFGANPDGCSKVVCLSETGELKVRSLTELADFAENPDVTITEANLLYIVRSIVRGLMTKNING
jgi:hypothetical protein